MHEMSFHTYQIFTPCPILEASAEQQKARSDEAPKLESGNKQAMKTCTETHVVPSNLLQDQQSLGKSPFCLLSRKGV
jgi:hypothetical protein